MTPAQIAELRKAVEEYDKRDAFVEQCRRALHLLDHHTLDATYRHKEYRNVLVTDDALRRGLEASLSQHAREYLSARLVQAEAERDRLPAPILAPAKRDSQLSEYD